LNHGGSGGDSTMKRWSSIVFNPSRERYRYDDNNDNQDHVNVARIKFELGGPDKNKRLHSLRGFHFRPSSSTAPSWGDVVATRKDGSKKPSLKTEHQQQHSHEERVFHKDDLDDDDGKVDNKEETLLRGASSLNSHSHNHHHSNNNHHHHHNRNTNKLYTFHMDTGNDAISIADPTLRENLAATTRGVWVMSNDGFCCVLAVPAEQMFNMEREVMEDVVDDLVVVLTDYVDVLEEGGDEAFDVPSSSSPSIGGILIPSQKWRLTHLQPVPHQTLWDAENFPENHRNNSPIDDESNYYYTIFETYHKNVLGLPFLAAIGMEYIFDDEEKVLHVLGGVDKSDGALVDSTMVAVEL